MCIGKKCFSFLAQLIAWIYVIIFIPTAPLIINSGLLIMSYPSMTSTGGIASLLGTTTISLAMPLSSYFIGISLAEKKYRKALFYCGLPFLCVLGAFLWSLLIIGVHNLLFRD